MDGTGSFYGEEGLIIGAMRWITSMHLTLAVEVCYTIGFMMH